jgi:hemolysin-activating ACP:hemolysin acyltransferase
VNHRLFGEVMELVHLDPYWGGVKTSSHTNSIYYAVKHGKCFVHHNGHKLLGFCTYGFFTRDEIEQDLWDGDEVYSRQSGEVLYFPKFQCRAGRKEVLRFVGK